MMKKSILLNLIAAFILTFGMLSSGTAHAADGKVQIVVTKIEFVVGAIGGSGLLTFEGDGFPLILSGLTIGPSAALSVAKMTGTANNMILPSDIEGTYTSIGGRCRFGARRRRIRQFHKRKRRPTGSSWGRDRTRPKSQRRDIRNRHTVISGLGPRFHRAGPLQCAIAGLTTRRPALFKLNALLPVWSHPGSRLKRWLRLYPLMAIRPRCKKPSRHDD